MLQRPYVLFFRDSSITAQVKRDLEAKAAGFVFVPAKTKSVVDDTRSCLFPVPY